MMHHHHQLPANHTLYVNNLNDKIAAETLKKSLHEVFAAFGEIVDIIAMKSLKRRGQAWIIFNDIIAATSAMKSLQGFPFYNKPLSITFAKTKSDIVAKADGTFVERPRRTLKQDPTQKNKKQQVAPMAIPGQNTHHPVTRAAVPHTPMESQMSTSLPTGFPGMPGSGAIPHIPGFDMQGMPNLQIPTIPGLENLHIPTVGDLPLPFNIPGIDMSQFMNASAAVVPGIEPTPAEPNKTLFVENIPEECNDGMLTMLFRQYPGFIEVRLIASRNVAFVDYQDERQSELALQGLNGFQVNATTKLKVTYARK